MVLRDGRRWDSRAATFDVIYSFSVDDRLWILKGVGCVTVAQQVVGHSNTSDLSTRHARWFLAFHLKPE